MKKISFAAPHEVALEIEGVRIKVISLPKIEIRQIYASEQRLARQVAKNELEPEKEDLQSAPFDAYFWAKNWYETSVVVPLRNNDILLSYAVETYDHEKENKESQESLRFRLMENASILAKEEAILENESTKFPTIYAGKNNGQKPPQSLYESQLLVMTEQNAVFGTYHHFIVDAETGEYFVDFAEDFKAKAYSPQRAILTEWITNYEELKDLVSAASLSNLLGFTEAKTKATAAQELTIIQDTGKKE